MISDIHFLYKTGKAAYLLSIYTHSNGLYNYKDVMYWSLLHSSGTTTKYYKKSNPEWKEVPSSIRINVIIITVCMNKFSGLDLLTILRNFCKPNKEM